MSFVIIVNLCHCQGLLLSRFVTTEACYCKEFLLSRILIIKARFCYCQSFLVLANGPTAAAGYFDNPYVLEYLLLYEHSNSWPVLIYY